MKRNDELLGRWIRRFLVEHLVTERNLSHNTQRSYRDTFSQLMPFIARLARQAVDRLSFDDFTPERIRAFLTAVEKKRECSIRTRNQRLAAVHAFARFVAELAPDRIEWCSTIRAVPFKRFERASLTYLDKPEIDALLAAPDTQRAIGQRDHALLLFLYNTGARASEAVAITIGDIESRPDGTASVRLTGKGAKTRFCPIWPNTLRSLQQIIARRSANDRLFLNQRGQPLTRYGVHAIVSRHAKAAAALVNSLSKKRVAPHILRHTTATHLLRSGVDINTIRAWLGHVSIDTTNVYAEIDLETKAKMLAACEQPADRARRVKSWKDDPGLLTFLRSL